MSTQLQRLGQNRPGSNLAGQLSPYSSEGRAVARSNRQAEAQVVRMNNEAALVDHQNALVNQIKRNEIGRRRQRATDVMHAQSAMIDYVRQGDPAKQMEMLDTYNAWKQGELYRMMTDE